MPPTPPMGAEGTRSRPGRTGDHPGPMPLRRPWRVAGRPSPVDRGRGPEGAGPSGEAGRPCPGDRGAPCRGSWGAPPTLMAPICAVGAPFAAGRRGHRLRRRGTAHLGRSRGAGTGRGAHLRRRGHARGRAHLRGGPFPGARPSEEDREDARPSAGEARLPSEAARPVRRSDASCRGDRAASCRWVDRLRSSGRGGARA